MVVLSFFMVCSRKCLENVDCLDCIFLNIYSEVRGLLTVKGNTFYCQLTPTFCLFVCFSFWCCRVFCVIYLRLFHLFLLINLNFCDLQGILKCFKLFKWEKKRLKYKIFGLYLVIGPELRNKLLLSDQPVSPNWGC